MYELKDKKNLIFIFLLITEIKTKNRKKVQVMMIKKLMIKRSSSKKILIIKIQMEEFKFWQLLLMNLDIGQIMTS